MNVCISCPIKCFIWYSEHVRLGPKYFGTFSANFLQKCSEWCWLLSQTTWWAPWWRWQCHWRCSARPSQLSLLRHWPECEHCEKRYVASSLLKAHIRDKHEISPEMFTCDYCKKEFNKKAKLKIHMTHHTGEKPFKCRVGCEKGFRNRAPREDHERMHRGVKEFQCTLCPKMFMKTSNLRVHVKRHEGKKEHQCAECGKAFVEPAGARNCKHSGKKWKKRNCKDLQWKSWLDLDLNKTQQLSSIIGQLETEELGKNANAQLCGFGFRRERDHVCLLQTSALQLGWECGGGAWRLLGK